MVDFPIDLINAPMTDIEFRRTLKNLFDSYHDTEMDILREIIQNSVDAIEDRFSNVERYSEEPEILLEIEKNNSTIKISDNGIGIIDEQISRLGRPSNTSKIEGQKRGYKGVGLSYVVWQTDLFRFATKRINESSTVSGKLESAQSLGPSKFFN